MKRALVRWSAAISTLLAIAVTAGVSVPAAHADDKRGTSIALRPDG